MDVTELVAFVAGGGVMALPYLWRLRRRFKHEHVYDHMTRGRWRCGVCEKPKKRGS